MTSLLQACSYVVATVAEGNPIVIGAKNITPPN